MVFENLNSLCSTPRSARTNGESPESSAASSKETDDEASSPDSEYRFSSPVSSTSTDSRSHCRANNTSSGQVPRALRCPFMHGTASAGPYPGYVQSRNPVLCPAGCVPVLLPSALETAQGTLLREAAEYCDLYHFEKQLSDNAKSIRWAEIEKDILGTGNYELTFDELEYGAKISWRNAPKCANRSKWLELAVMDCRTVESNEEAFRCLLKLMEDSITSGATITRMAVFPSKKPKQMQGPRIWNSMLLRFAGYKITSTTDAKNIIDADSAQDSKDCCERKGILGDPADAEFTETLINRFGWTPPFPKSQFDVLPLLIQIDEKAPPQCFKIPSRYIPTVPLTHPYKPKFNSMELRWFGIPLVSGLEMTIGGLCFPMCPFVGWFMDLEVVRNLTDAGRYNLIAPIAKSLDLDTSTANELWKDQAFLAINEIILRSFRNAGYAVVTHHTMMREFILWYRAELHNRGYCPGNWKWIIPPACSSLYEGYQALNKMQEYTLKPAILPPKAGSWRNYKMSIDFDTAMKAFAIRLTKPSKLLNVTSTTKNSVNLLFPQLPESFNADGRTIQTRKNIRYFLIFARVIGRFQSVISRKQPDLVIMYASVSGTTVSAAHRLSDTLRSVFSISLVNLEEWSPAVHVPMLRNCLSAVFMTSTYGSGEPPPRAHAFLQYLKLLALESKDIIDSSIGRAVKFNVLGFGSSAYPRFCVAADAFESALQPFGERISPIGKIDSLSGSDSVYQDWLKCLVTAIMTLPRIKLSTAALLKKFQCTLQADLAKKDSVKLPGNSLNLVQIIGATKIETKFAQVSTGTITLVRQVTINNACDGDEEASRTVIEVHIDCAECPEVSYSPGDVILIYPRHPKEVVDRAAELFGLRDALDEVVSFTVPGSYDNTQTINLQSAAEFPKPPFPTPTSIRTILTCFLSIESVPSYNQFIEVAQHAAWKDIDAINTVVGWNNLHSPELYNSWQQKTRTNWMELFQMIPSLKNAPRNTLLQSINVMHPRYYSIASASSVSPKLIGIKVAVQTYKSRDGHLRTGLCSGFLQALEVSSQVDFRLVKTPNFRLPLSCTSPVICVSIGSGFAPFRGFVQERVFRMAEAMEMRHSIEWGPFIVIQGCCTMADNLLFFDELDAARSTGAISNVYFAYSRSLEHPKQYVQDIIFPPVTPRKNLKNISSSRVADIALTKKNVLSSRGLAVSESSNLLHLSSPGSPHLLVLLDQLKKQNEKIEKLSASPNSCLSAFVNSATSDSSQVIKSALAHPFCYIYVCGNMRMAEDVENAFRSLIGIEEVRSMKNGGRYKEEIFGSA